MNQTLSRLQPGMVVRYDGRPHRVVMVNDCRARIVAVERRTREFVPQTGPGAGVPVRLTVAEAGHNISPDSDCEILAPA